ncbi:MAG: outer membrane protein transport protein [Sulfurospirillum sp.]|nr:outer membrane protein transport protein [Sulfurospirillum sp.]
MNNYLKGMMILSLNTVILSASGFKIAEQSLNSTAMNGANIASANGADASYYNPANMAWMDKSAEIETAIMIRNYGNDKHEDHDPGFNGEAEAHNVYTPTFHYISKATSENLRFGFSLVESGAISVKWGSPRQMLEAEDVNIRIMELNPTASYKIHDKLAVGFGLRGVYTQGAMKTRNESEETLINGDLYQNEINFDSIDVGYNLAVSYKPTRNLVFSSTYRSEVDLTVEGDAKGWTKDRLLDSNGDAKDEPLVNFNTSVSTQVALPATLSFATAYTMAESTGEITIEFVYERTYWSSYDSLEFKFDDATVDRYFGSVAPRDWKDTTAYRVGGSFQATNDLKLMIGFALDESPVPAENFSFILPDSDAKLYSTGFEYRVNDDIKLGLAYQYKKREEVTIVNEPSTDSHETKPINGVFENSADHLLLMSMSYIF